MVTFSSARSNTFATALRATPGTCVGTHRVALSPRNSTVQFIGSMVACAKKGAVYSADRVFLLSAITLFASATFQKLKPDSLSFIFFSSAKLFALEKLSNPLGTRVS